MRLFLKDHLSIIITYLITFIGLPILIDELDGFENHYKYFVFLSLCLLAILLFSRFIRRKKMYTSMNTRKEGTNNFLIHQPHASIEQAYASEMRRIQSTLLSKEDEHKEILKEQELMISQVVHQMKTPLSAIDLIVQDNQIKHPQLFVEWQKLRKESNKLNFSLNQLLTYNRSSEILADFKIEPIFLKGMVQEVINDLKEYFIEKEVYPKNFIEKDTVIYSDKKWLKVVIYQLLSNSIKYGEKSSSVLIQLEDGILRIRNKGEKIPDNDILRVFDLFYTGAKGRIKSDATGIGLYLVKKILSTLNHPYSLSSCHNETIFTIDFSNNANKDE